MQSNEPFLFFAGIDGVAPLIHGQRRDQQLISQHRTNFWRTDFSNVQRLKMDTLRWGPNWYQVNPEQGIYDWSEVDDRIDYARNSNLKLWYVLQHKQVPDWVEILDPAFPAALRAYGEAVARRYPHIDTFCISVEPEFYALISCDWGKWQPHRTDAFNHALDSFAAAITETAQAIKYINPAARIIHTDFAPGVRLARMVADYVDALALDYYPCHYEYDLAGWIDYWHRHVGYKPLYIGETGIAGGWCDHDQDRQRNWLRDTLQDCREAIERGIDVRGYCPYPTLVDNFYWGSNQVHEYSSKYPPGIDTHIGDNAGSFFRLRPDEQGLYRRELVPQMYDALLEETRIMRRFEQTRIVRERILVPA